MTKSRTYYSQSGQDKWIAESVFPGVNDGFFLDIGCGDGYTYSNSRALEELGWQGIAVDPFPTNWARRSCVLARNVLSAKGDQVVPFRVAGMLGGIDEQIRLWRKQVDAHPVVHLTTTTVESLLKEHRAPRFLHYVSIDTEGSEYEILTAFPFNEYRVGAFTIEHNFEATKRQSICRLLEHHGYRRVASVQMDDWYLEERLAKDFRAPTVGTQTTLGVTTHGEPMTDEAHAAERYNAIARDVLKAPPDPRFSSLSLDVYRRSLAVSPNNIATYLEMADAHHNLGQTEEALHCCDAALRRDPTSVDALLKRCMLASPVLLDYDDNIEDIRDRYKQYLSALTDRLEYTDQATLVDVSTKIGLTPFYIHFHGKNDREIQVRYGGLISRATAARFPQFGATPPASRPRPGERIRIGFVSNNLRAHAVFRVLTRGWLAGLDRRRFELHAYSLGSQVDDYTTFARDSVDVFRDGPLTLADWAARIHADKLHVLIYPEVGMHTLTTQLASLRLAPIQCATWGFPITTGLPTVDYFLSGQAAEPSGAQDSYSERLICLPGLGIQYSPIRVEHMGVSRSDFNLPESVPIFLCAQSLFKYLPEHDHLIAQVANATGDCLFLFHHATTSHAIAERFMRRLGRTFAEYGLTASQYLRMLPSLPYDAYWSLNRIATLALDTPQWSGGATTLDAIDHDLPLVTLPGATFRSRISYALLTELGVTDTIVRSQDEYVDLAASIARNQDRLDGLSNKIKSSKHALYDDSRAIRKLEHFLIETISTL